MEGSCSSHFRENITDSEFNGLRCFMPLILTESSNNVKWMSSTCLFQVEVKRALPKEVQQQQAALRAAVAGRGMIPAIGKWHYNPSWVKWFSIGCWKPMPT